jgi:putative acetyltransferase
VRGGAGAHDGLMMIEPAIATADFAQVRVLLAEYAAESKLDLCFQGFETELATLPGPYAPPGGVLFVARTDGVSAGCGGLREFSRDACEMKRLFVRPAFRKQGAGRLIARALIGEARRLGYFTMRLDTLASMHAALALYESLGFRRIPAYYANPLPEVVYLELSL